MTLEEAIVISIRKYYDNHDIGDKEEGSDHNLVYTNKFFDDQEKELLGEEVEAPKEKETTPKGEAPALDEEEIKGMLDGI